MALHQEPVATKRRREQCPAALCMLFEFFGWNHIGTWRLKTSLNDMRVSVRARPRAWIWFWSMCRRWSLLCATTFTKMSYWPVVKWHSTTSGIFCSSSITWLNCEGSRRKKPTYAQVSYPTADGSTRHWDPLMTPLAIRRCTRWCTAAPDTPYGRSATGRTGSEGRVRQNCGGSY